MHRGNSHYRRDRSLIGGALKPLIQDKWPFFWVFVCNLMGALLEGASFGFVFRALEKISDPQQFLKNILIGIGIQIARSICLYFSANKTTQISTKWQAYFQSQIFERIMNMSFSRVNKYKTGELVEYLKLPAACVHIFLDNSNKFLACGFAILALAGTMLILSPLLFLMAVVVFGGFGFLQKVIIKKVSKVSIRYQQISTEITRYTLQCINGLRAIFTFQRQAETSKNVNQSLLKLSQAIKKMSLWNNTILPINEITGILLVAIFFVLGFITSNASSFSLLMTFVLIAYRLNGKVQGLFTHAANIAEHFGQLRSLNEFLNEPNQDTSKNMGTPFIVDFDRIYFKDVSLIYPGERVEALRQINFTIDKGKMIAIVGPSGAGKSSIVDLLIRLYEPTSGEILINGKPFNEIKLEDLRRNLGVVSQEVFIFHDTIEENIRFGMAHVSSERIREAATIAGAAEFIEKLPDAYQAVVGERGHRLSGGERQRIALARALLRQPTILVLDEATSSLDSASEARIKKTLETLKGTMTMVIVAHRLSTIMESDSIVVIDRGRVQAVGTHDDLLKSCPLYASLWQLQVQKANSLQGSLDTLER